MSDADHHLDSATKVLLIAPWPDGDDLARAQVYALMSIAESLLTLTEHLTEKETQKEEGTP